MDEVIILTGHTVGEDGADNKLFENVLKEQWQLLFNEDEVKQILDVLASEEDSDADLGEVLLSIVKNVVMETKASHRNIALLGIMSLKLFLQANWTGPKIVVENLGLLENILQSKNLNQKSMAVLASDGEDLYELVMYPVLLLIAHTVLVKCAAMINLFVTLPIWSVKSLATYFAVLEEIRDCHLKMFKEVVNPVEINNNLFADLPKDVLAEFYLDCSHLYLKFYDYKNAEDCHEKVKQLLKIDMSLTASLGKRTKFQYKNLPQMKLDVKVQEEREPIRTVGESTKDLPTDVTLDNDTLLPHIKFINSDSVKNIELSPVDQAFALTLCMYLRKTRPRDKLSHEEILPFVDAVLQAPQSWSIQHRSLYLRCLTEITNSRKAERALTQLESLASSIEKETPKAFLRQLHMHSVNMEPNWIYQQTHAQLLFTIGLVDSSLDIFLRMQLWDDVISCYQRLGKHGKAEAVIREQLELRETATLWCLLGDATANEKYYLKAWEVSKERSARAQRSMGLWHLRRNEYEEAIPYFQRSLDLNCLQPGIAFSLGCCGMQAKKPDVAVGALQQSCQLDPGNHEAWNNLASCFIRLNQLKHAYKALQEATRLSYENWKIWENFLLVCTDIGVFEEAMNACNRLIDLNRKEIDTEVLHVLVQAVLNNEEDFHGNPASRLKPKLLKLFGHITSKITSVSNIWEEYARLCLDSSEVADKEKALQFLYKSHRCYTQQTDWEKSEKMLPDVKRVTDKMMEVTNEVCLQDGYNARAISLYSTTKMAISNLILRLKKAYATDSNDIIASVQPIITELESHVQELQANINSIT